VPPARSLEEKIRKLDEQLMKHRDIIKKTRPGPAQEAAKRRALQARRSPAAPVHLALAGAAAGAHGARPAQVLKQKRLYEGQREQLYNQQFNMDQTAFTLESIKDSVTTVQAMKAANTELKQAFKKGELNIDSIEKLQDEMADMHVRSAHVSVEYVLGHCLVSLRTPHCAVYSGAECCTC